MKIDVSVVDSCFVKYSGRGSLGDEHLAVRIRFNNSSLVRSVKLDKVIYGDSGDCVIIVYLGKFVKLLCILSILPVK